MTYLCSLANPETDFGVVQTAVILDPYAQSVVWRRQYGQLGMVSAIPAATLAKTRLFNSHATG